MSDSFNGYHVWLGIPPGEQPPNHYRLLGIAPFETDLDVIDHAADRQMAHVRTFQSGRNAALSQQILNELAAARVCLLNPQRKADYDEQLRAKTAAPIVAPVPVGKALPVAQPVGESLAAAVPRATPVSKPDEADEIGVDLDNSVPLASRVADDDDLLGDLSNASPGPAIRVRDTGRPVDRDASLMRAMVYILAGVAVVIVIMVLAGVVQRNWRDWFPASESSAPAESGDDAAPMPEIAPPAPTPQPGTAADAE